MNIQETHRKSGSQYDASWRILLDELGDAYSLFGIVNGPELSGDRKSHYNNGGIVTLVLNGVQVQPVDLGNLTKDVSSGL